MNITILGRQPILGLAELESLYGAKAVRPLGDYGALVDAQLEPERLGGSLRVAKPLLELPYTDWRRLSEYCIQHLPEQLSYLPSGKLRLGLSVYGLSVSSQQLFRTGLELKKVCRKAGRSTRIVPPEGQTLNSAAVLHNQMTGPLGMELLFLKNGKKTWLAKTTWIQDIDDYARRDYGRPRRDAFVGMLPPKLAQSMLNLAQVQHGQHVLDPFCGTGVVLQEAALLGCSVHGTDLNERMITFSRENLHWLSKIYNLTVKATLEVADATNATWKPPLENVVCETYLGQPLSSMPKADKLQHIIRDCNTIISKFLTNLRRQLPTGMRLCIAIPAWAEGQQFHHLPLLDRLEEMGYNRVRFQHAPDFGDLVYHRDNQIVARELLILTAI